MHNAFPRFVNGRLPMPVSYASFVVLTLGLTGMIAFMTYRTGQLLRHWQPDRNLLLVPAENLIRILLIATCIGLGVLSGLPPQQLGWTLDIWPAAVAWGILWGAALALVFYFSTQWLVKRTGRRYYSPAVAEAVVPRQRAEYWPVMAAMLPVVILEELLFRSLLIGGMEPIVPAPILLAGTAIIFGIMHAPQGLWGIAGASLAGLVLGALFLAFGSIVAAIVAHYVANTAQIHQLMRARQAAAVIGANDDRGRDHPLDDG